MRIFRVLAGGFILSRLQKMLPLVLLAGVPVLTSNSLEAASASFKSYDLTTEGNWKGVYGQGGSIIPNDATNTPAYATVSFSSSALTYTWLASTTDVRCLLKTASTTDRIASTYYTSSNFKVDINITDGQSHQLVLYLLDYDNGNRNETISILDGTSGAVLDSRGISNFTKGAYAIWNIQGHVLVQVSYTGGVNAILSGIFFSASGQSSGAAPPTVSISSPASGASVNGTTTISATATSTAGIASVQFELDGKNIGSPVTGGGPAYSYQWATTGATNGSHTLQAVATDVSGQSTTSAGVVVSVANTVTTPAPTVSISAPTGGSVASTTTVSATASSSAGIASVQFMLDGSKLGTAVTTSPYAVQWNTATASNGSHTLTAVATDTLGQSTTSSPVTVTVSNSASTGAATASFANFDSTTEGSWRGIYGKDGYLIANDSNSPPSYATLGVSGASQYTWYPSTTDPRALIKGGSTTDRIASTYFAASSFTFDVNLTDGQSHQVAIYSLDLDTTTRAQTISLLDATAGTTLDTRSLANFHSGVWAVWNVTGHVTVKVVCTGGLNAVVSGIFFGGAPVTTPPPVVSMSSPASGASVSGTTTISATATSTAGIAAVQFVLDGKNLGAPVTGSSPYSYAWATTGATNGSHSLQAIATDTLGQSTTSAAVPVTVANTVATPPPTVSISSPASGASVSGTTAISATATSSAGIASVQFVLDGKNLGAPVTGSSPYSYAWATTGATNGSHSLQAIATDTLGQSTTSAAVPVTVANTVPTAPPTVSLSSPASGTSVTGTTTIAATATSTAGIATVQFLLDGNNLGSPVTGSGPSFSYQWTTTGATNTSHTLQAIATDILGQSTTSAGVTVTVANTSGASATFVKTDTTTLGTWKGVYGQDGYIIANDSKNPPTYATVAVSGAATYTWLASSQAARDLQKGASTTDRIASTFFSATSFTFDINFTDGQTHTLAIYCVDWDNQARSETVKIIDANSGTQLDSRSLSSFVNGLYLVWTVSGHIQLQVSNANTINAVLSGLFFSPASGGGSSVPAPSISITAPAAQATVSGTVTVTASASSTVGLSSVQFKLDSTNLGTAVTGAGPTFSTQWNTATSSSGPHTLTAVATDTTGQQTTSAPVQVNNSGGTGNGGPSSAQFLGTDTGTQGSWKGSYGQDGYVIANDSNAPASYVTMAISGASAYSWVASTSDPRALTKGASASDRIASTYFSSGTFTFDINLTDGQLHRVSLYNLDFDKLGRQQSFSVVDAVSGTVLDSEQLTANFGNGIWYSWNVKGHVQIQVTNLGSLNGVVSGIFFDPPVLPPTLSLSSNAVTFASISSGTNPAAQTVSISNTGGSVLNWTAANTQPWLTITPGSGTAPSTLSLSVNTSGLAAGTYSDTITVTGANAGSSPQTISVSLNVSPAAPALSTSLQTLSFSTAAGNVNPAEQFIALGNTGGGTLNWTANYTQSWLSLSAASGSAPGTLGVSVNIASLPPGSYSDTITITGASGTQNSPQTVKVYLQVVATSGLVAKWTFEPSTISGTTVTDVSGDGLYGTIHGNVTPTAGKVGQGVNFDGGTGSYILTAPDTRPAMANDLTLTAWIRTTNASRSESIISKYNSTGSEDGYIFETTSAGFLALQLGGADIVGNGNIIDGVTKINDGQWHLAVLIIRPGQDVSFYVDGGLSSIYYLTTAEGGYAPPVNIGGGVGSHASSFTGQMDEVQIYSRALSTTEIAQMWGSTVTTAAGGQILYNGIAMPKNFPPPTQPTQALRTPYYINNPPQVITIDLGRQLFVDDFLIEQTSMQRNTHQPSFYSPNPVLTPGAPISGGLWYDPTAQQYKMWFYNTNAVGYSQYATSSDGINWTLPTISNDVVPGTSAVVPAGDTIWFDQQETDPTRRYKAFAVDSGALKVYVYFSADGINWSAKQSYNINTLSDRTTFFWNPFRSVWVNSDRGTAPLPATPLAAAAAKRSRYYSESPDLANWTPANPSQSFWTGADDHDPPYYLYNPGGQPPELYTLDCVAYESLLVGMFSWFYPGAGYSTYTLPGPTLVELGTGFSRDGFSWVRPTRGSGPSGAFIPASNTAGTWNAYNTQSVGGDFLVVGDELWFYFSARTLQKPLDGTFSTGLATLRRDGFYSMDAGSTQATLVTHPVKFSGSHMFVNVNDPSGTLLVEVLDANGNVLPAFAAANCTPLGVNKTLQEVTWNGATIGSLAGQNVKFRFYLTNGSLYSFWVTSDAHGASHGYVAAGGPGFTGVTDTVGSAGYPAGQN